MAFLAAALTVAALSGCTARYVRTEDLVDMPPAPPKQSSESLASAPSWSDSLPAITLEAAIGRVLLSNPELDAARSRLGAADALRVQSRAWDNPSLGGEVEGLGRAGSDPAEITLSVGMPVDFFAKRGIRVDVAHANVNVARARYNRERQGIVSRTRFAFHSVLASQEQLLIAEARLRVTEATAEALGRQVDVGKAPLIEKLRAEIADETARSEARSARSDLRVAQRELASLWGGTLHDTDQVHGTLRIEMPRSSVDSLVAELRSQHPLLQEQLWLVERERQKERLVRRERWPDVIPNAGIRWIEGGDTRDFVAGIDITLPVLDRKGGSVRAAQLEREAASKNAEDTHLRLTTTLDLILEELRDAHRRLETYTTEALPRAREALDLARMGYEGGKFGFLILLDAQTTLIDVESARTDALVAFDRALVRLESLLGRKVE